MASVKVAVRSRPLSKRELASNAKVILRMDNNITALANIKRSRRSLTDSNDENCPEKYFSFDHCYWSTDRKSSRYAVQANLYEDLGSEVVKNALAGYNACMFAYGQTGAGKTFTMTGNDNEPGLIPRICEDLFTSLNEETVMSYRLEVSYMEIYNEQVRDLLKIKRDHKIHNNDNAFLRIREHPKEGPFVQDLTVHPVSNYKSIESLMELGNSIRVTASTLMNDTSSRSHAILKIKLTQARLLHGMPSETVSHINLVDLAGSERASSSGAVGIRLKEGGNINKSLVTLGLVISILADKSSTESKHKKQTFVPYRDSILTWLLKDSLGGNSKTIMIATVSPADVNHGETLSTLRYASRARRIVNQPVINEDSNVKVIKELREEIQRLKELMNNNSSTSEKENVKALDDKMNEKLLKSQQRADELTKTWMEKWKETQQIFEERSLTLRKCGSQTFLTSQRPHLVCLDGDPLCTDVILYHLEEGKTTIGSSALTEEQTIALEGSGIEDEHCYTFVSDHHVTMKALSQLCFVNNRELSSGGTIQLKQGDVVQFGHYLRFRFNNPGEAAVLRQKRRSGHYSSMPNLNRSSDSGLGSPDSEEMERSESCDYLRIPNLTPDRSFIQTPSELSSIPDEEDDFHWKQEQIDKENKELNERRELLRDLMQKYRDAELQRIDNEANQLKDIEEEAKVFAQQKCDIEQERSILMKQLKAAHRTLTVWNSKQSKQKEKKRRLVEQEINKLVSMQKRNSNGESTDIDRDMRKRKFQLKSKIEEYWKRMDLYENVLIENELIKKKKAIDDIQEKNNINDDNSYDDVSECHPDRSTLDNLKNEMIQLKEQLSIATVKWDDELNHIDESMKQMKENQATILKDCEKSVARIDSKMVKIDEKHIKERAEIHMAIKDARSADIPCDAVVDLHKSRLASVDAEYREIINKLKSERDIILNKTKREWDRVENDIQDHESRMMDLTRVKDDELESLTNQIVIKEHELESIETILNSIELKQTTNNTKIKRNAYQEKDINEYYNNVTESKDEVKDLLTRLIKTDDMPTDINNSQLKTWTASLQMADLECNQAIDSVVSCCANQKENDFHEIVTKHSDILTIEEKLNASQSTLKELAERQLQNHQKVVASHEKQKEMLNHTRLKEKEKIAENIDRLVKSTSSDHVAKYLCLEEKKMTEFQQHLDELETSLLNKMAERKVIEEKLCCADPLTTDEGIRMRSLSYISNGPTRDDFDISFLKSKKELYDNELEALKQQIERERKEYVDTLNDQEEYEVIGNEYQEIRQLTFQVQSNVAISDILRQVYYVANMMEVKPDHLKVSKHLQCGGWRYFSQGKGVSVFSKLETGKLSSFIGCGIIRAKPEIVYDAVRNPLSRFVFDGMLKQINILEHINDTLKIVYMRHEARVCLLKQARDFCCLHHERIEDDKFVVASQSVEHPDCIKWPGAERAHVLPSGWVIEPLASPNGAAWSLVSYLIRIDIGDDVSSAVTKYLSTRLPYSVAYLRDYLVMR